MFASGDVDVSGVTWHKAVPGLKILPGGWGVALAATNVTNHYEASKINLAVASGTSQLVLYQFYQFENPTSPHSQVITFTQNNFGEFIAHLPDRVATIKTIC